jgi:hypothetical protein
MEWVGIHGLMVVLIKVSIKMILKLGLEFILGEMVKSTEVIGKMECKTD